MLAKKNFVNNNGMKTFDRKTKIFVALDEDIILWSMKSKDSRPIFINWKSWEMREELSHYSAWHLKIPYLKIREEFQEAPPGKLCFLMIDPMEALLWTLERWYRLGAQKRAFPFFEAFKEKVDELDHDASDFAGKLADWLIEQNPRPLYNPQIATLDLSRRLYMAKKLLKKDFDCKRIVSVDEARLQIDRSLISRIDARKDRETFETFFKDDTELFNAIESKVLEKVSNRDKKEARSPKNPQRAGVRKKALITKVTSRRIEGWVSIDDLSEESPFLVLRVNGQRVRRRELPKISEKNDSKSPKGRRRVKFSLKGLKLSPRDRVVLVLNPERIKIPFSVEAKKFFVVKE